VFKNAMNEIKDIQRGIKFKTTINDNLLHFQFFNFYDNYKSSIDDTIYYISTI